MVALVHLVRRVHVVGKAGTSTNFPALLSRPRIDASKYDFHDPAWTGYYACDISVKGGGKNGFFSGGFHKT